MVLWPRDAGGGHALLPAAVAGIGAYTPTANVPRPVPASVRWLLVAGGAAAVHHGGDQVAQLLASSNTGCGAADLFRSRASGSLARFGLGQLFGAGAAPGGRLLVCAALGSADQRPGNADPGFRSSGQWPGVARGWMVQLGGSAGVGGPARVPSRPIAFGAALAGLFSPHSSDSDCRIG